MRAAGLLLIGSLAACQAQGGPDAYEETQPSLFCGTVEPSMTAKLSIESEMRAHPVSMTTATINVYVHVIRRGVGADNGDVSDDQIHNQLAVMNAAYKSTGFTFELASIDRTTNTAWFTMADGTAAEHDAKALLRKGTSRDLNLYTAAPGGGSLGWATFPSAAKGDPIGDGVVMLYTALPGGPAGPFDQGDQTVHEVGHWLGLFHTFSAECDTNGDFVDDTAASDAPAYGCPIGRDTCGGGGEDAVRNFMDSTDDGCMNAFTAGQAARMRAQFAAFRLR